MRSRSASVLNRSQPLQLLDIKIGMYFFSKGNTDIHNGRILCDQLFTIGDHMLRIPLGVDKSGRCILPDLLNSTVLFFVGMQFEDQLPVPRDPDAVTDKGRTVIGIERLPDIRSSHQY